MPEFDLNDAAHLVAVAEAGGFRAAAQRRTASASALSEAVRRLDEAVGARLLNRTTRSVALTEAGARFVDRVRPALAEIAAALDGVSGDPERPTGTLRLNVPTFVARHILPPIATAFLKRHPGVRMDVMAQDSFIDVLAEGCDAGIRYEERLALDVIATPIGPRRQRFVLAAAPSYLAERGTPAHPRDLVRHDRIGHRFTGSKALAIWEFERDGEVIRVPPEGPLVASTFEMQIAAARGGLGIIGHFGEALAADLASGALVPVMEDWWQEFSGPMLYYQSRRLMPAPLRAFVDFVKSERPAAAD